MTSLTLVYISLSGNTHSFVTRFATFLKETHDIESKLINIKDLKHETFPIEEEFLALLPTYLEGGNGLDKGDTEMLTTPLRQFIAAHDNYKNCFGIIGSGNRNFNHQYCLSAKQYAKQFDFPMLADFELRGTSADIERIAPIVLKAQADFNNIK